MKKTNIAQPPVSDPIVDDENKAYLGWLDWFVKLGKVFEGVYYSGDDYTITPDIIIVHAKIDSGTSYVLPVSGQGFLTVLEEGSTTLQGIEVDGATINLPSYTGYILVQGILKRI